MAILKKDKKKPAKDKKTATADAAIVENNAGEREDGVGSAESSKAMAEMIAEVVAKSNKFTHRLMTFCTVFILILIGGYGFIAWQTSSSVSALDDNIQVTLESVKELNTAIDKLAESQGEFKIQQGLLAETVAKVELSVNDMQGKIPASAEKVSVETSKVVAKIKDFEKVMSNQGENIAGVSNVVTSLGSQLKKFEARLQNVQKLSSDVEALVTLEKEKYFSILERQADLQEKQSGPDPIKVPRDPNLVFYSIISSE